MNRIYRSIWNHKTATFVAVAENVKCTGKQSSPGASVVKAGGFVLKALATSLMLAFGSAAYAAPAGEQVVSGTGAISQTGTTTTINQSSQHLSLNWQSFNIAPQETVNFVQPSASAIAVNRIFDTNGTQILGRLNANGQVYLINPNGILFGQGAQVNVGGLVASTLELNGAAMHGDTRAFSGNGSGSIINQGTINAASGGYVALLGNRVINQGTITAPRGTVALGAGNAVTLTFQDNSLVKLEVDQSVLNSLAENGGLIRADGGKVFMSAGARDALLASVVNNTGVIEARTVENREGSIVLLGGMAAGTTNVGGTLDASAPTGGDGGFIETSAARVNIADDARISTAAPHGKTGNWLIDPEDFIVAASSGNITGAALSNLLTNNSVTVQTGAGTDSDTNRYGTAGSNGDIFVNDGVSWSANTLTLKAHRNIDINAVMNGSGDAKLALEYGQGAPAAGNTAKATMHAAVNLPEGENYSTKLGSDGAVKTYFVIASLGAAGDIGTGANTLQGMAATANLGRNFALGANINATATASWNSSRGFTPIGNATTAYSGSFDGLGHDISGLTLRPAFTSDGNTYVGLFGRTAATAEVSNVGLPQVTIQHFAESRTGALIGMNAGKVSASYAEGSVRGNTHIGGLVGVNDVSGSIDRSYYSGSVTAGNRVGGLVGINSGSISNSYSTGTVSSSAAQDFVGGLVGTNGGSISASYASAAVSNSNSDAAGRHTGSLIGYNSGTVTDSYWNSQVSLFPGIDGGTTTGANGLTNAQMKQQSSFTGWDFAQTWFAQDGSSAPLLRAFMVPLTVTANDVTKAYDGSAYVDQSGVSFSIAPDFSNLTGAVSYGAVSAGPVNVGTYALNPTGYVSKQQGYIINYGGGTLTVNPAVVSLSGTKVYDANTAFAAVNFGNSGLIGTGVAGETLVLSGAGSVASANVNSGAQALTLGSLALGNGSGQASNYTLVGGTHTGTVTPAVLTATVTASDKVYDGVTSATPMLMITSGLVGSETLQVSGTATFNSKDVATANLVTVNSVSLADGDNGGLASNYTLAPGQSTAAAILRRTLTVSGITAGDKIYDGTTAATVNTAAASYTGLVSGDDLTLSATGLFADKNAANNKTVTLVSTYGGADVNNYSITGQATARASITPANLAVTNVTANSKAYDGTTVATLSGTPSVTAFGTDVVTVTGIGQGAFADPSVGSGKAVVVSGYTLSGTDAGNYTIVQPMGLTADIKNGAPSAQVQKPAQVQNTIGELQANVLPFQPSSASAGRDASSTITMASGNPDAAAVIVGGTSPSAAANTSADAATTASGNNTSHNGIGNTVVMNVGTQGSKLHIVNGGVRLPANLTNDNGK